MIDIDPDVEQEWMYPKEGFHHDGDEEEDFVSFGKNCVDRLVSSLGDQLMLPLIGQLVMTTMANTQDWRYKHAGLMAFSQVGEYVDDPEKIRPIIPSVIAHTKDPNPKIRYASLHAIGQIADDMPEDFPQTYSNEVLPCLYEAIDDQIPRVAAHACAALSNFMEGYKGAVNQELLKSFCQKLVTLVQNGCSLVKENAVTSLAAVAEQVKEAFTPFFIDTL